MVLSACAPHNTLRLLSAVLQWPSVAKSSENILHLERIWLMGLQISIDSDLSLLVNLHTDERELV